MTQPLLVGSVAIANRKHARTIGHPCSTLKYSGGTVTVPDCSALTLGAAHLIFATIADDYDKDKRVPDDVRAFSTTQLAQNAEA